MRTIRGNLLARALSASAFAAVLISVPHGAFAAQVWMACTGNVTSVSGGSTKTEASQRIVAFDDETQRLYQYSDKRKMLDPVAVASYTPGKITWGNNQINASGATWDASLTRPAMTLEIAWRDREGMTMNWKEQCKPTNPL